MQTMLIFKDQVARDTMPYTIGFDRTRRAEGDGVDQMDLMGGRVFTYCSYNKSYFSIHTHVSHTLNIQSQNLSIKSYPLDKPHKSPNIHTI